MNLLSNLINEYRDEQTRRRADDERVRAAEDAKREHLKREALHQLTIKGPLTAFEMAEMLDGSETYISHKGWQYDVSVVCANGFELSITYHVNPQRPDESQWGHPQIFEVTRDGERGAMEWFAFRDSVVRFIGSRLDTRTGGDQ